MYYNLNSNLTKFILVISLSTSVKFCLAQDKEFVCESFIIENKYRFVESVPISNNSSHELYITLVHNILIDELNSIQFSIPVENQMDSPVFVWIKLSNGLYLDLNVTGYAKRRVNGVELPTALVKPSKEMLAQIINESAELVKIRYGDENYQDVVFNLKDRTIFSKLLACVTSN